MLALTCFFKRQKAAPSLHRSEPPLWCCSPASEPNHVQSQMPGGTGMTDFLPNRPLLALLSLDAIPVPFGLGERMEGRPFGCQSGACSSPAACPPPAPTVPAGFWPNTSFWGGGSHLPACLGPARAPGRGVGREAWCGQCGQGGPRQAEAGGACVLGAHPRLAGLSLPSLRSLPNESSRTTPKLEGEGHSFIYITQEI